MNRTQFKALLSSMPALRHSIPGQDFDIKNSEVVAWLWAHDEVKQMLFQIAAGTKRIVYDAPSGTWHGYSALVDDAEEEATSGRPRLDRDTILSLLLERAPNREMALTRMEAWQYVAKTVPCSYGAFRLVLKGFIADGWIIEFNGGGLLKSYAAPSGEAALPAGAGDLAERAEAPAQLDIED